MNCLPEIIMLPWPSGIKMARNNVSEVMLSQQKSSTENSLVR